MKRFYVKDVITTVILSILLIVAQFIVNMVCMLNYFVSMILSVGISCFICAPVYVLLVHRVAKRMVSLLYMTLLGFVFFIMGDWFLLPYFFIVGVLCELILWKEGSSQKYGKITAAWSLYSVLYTGVNLLPLWFFWDDFKKNVLASGMRQDYMESYMNYYTNVFWVLAATLINLSCALAGCFLAKTLMKKHFAKAEIV
ncbi:MAG: MptD family putative ECF transporter S component [Spirochaetaceae bacterium]|nr:MptD family putative ECF transporter S component [Spirochaetaceae bacterium]